MAYTMGKVEPYTASLGNAIGPKFGIKTIGGYNSGPSSYGHFDHPLGLALDFMTNNIGGAARSNPTGRQLADYLVANAKPLGVHFVIWDRKIWSVEQPTWRAYSGDSDHTDHVHMSLWNAADRAKHGATGNAVAAMAAAGKAGATAIGGSGAGDGLIAAVGNAANALGTMATGANQVGDLAKKLMWFALPSTQVRLVAGGAGIALIALGVYFISKEVRGG